MEVDTPSPLFNDSAECKRWMDSLPLTNIQLAQEMLHAELARLALRPVAALERLKMLETFTEPVAFVQSEAAKRYAGKPLPLEAGEAEVWSNVVSLWQELARNYQECLKTYRGGDLAIAPYAALITMRCLRYAGCVMREHYKAYRQPAGTAWRTLHELYAYSEQQGFARIRVPDMFSKHDPDSSCAETYIQVLLSHLANPFSLSVRQMVFVNRWLEKWAALVNLAVQPLPTGPIPALAVDLAGGEGVELAGELEAQPSLRYLDLEQLSKALRHAISLLKQGQTPGELGFGEDARQPGCENLIMLLYVQWCRAGTVRMEERMAAQDTASACFGISAAHFQLSGGRAFRQPGELTSREKQDLDTFGYISRVDHEVGGGEGDSVETWQVVNQSASGFMCMLREPEGHARLTHNQLLAVRRSSGKQFHLGMVQWLKVDENNHVCCGVRLFPGVPQPIAIRPSNFNPVGSSRYERALLLPEVPTPATPATLVLPAGWFQSGRFVEIFSDRKQVAKLLNLLEKGSDFDRGTIAIV
jgi:hypothetical protein